MKITFDCNASEYRLPDGDVFVFVPRVGEMIESYSIKDGHSTELEVTSVTYTLEGDVKVMTQAT